MVRIPHRFTSCMKGTSLKPCTTASLCISTIVSCRPILGNRLTQAGRRVSRSETAKHGPASAFDPKKVRLIRVLGPGLITGASDDDPSGIATYSQAGAQFGFAISWTMLFSYPIKDHGEVSRP